MQENTICVGFCFNRNLTLETTKCKFCNHKLCSSCSEYNPIYSLFWCKKMHTPFLFFIELRKLYMQIVLKQDIWNQLNLIISKFSNLDILPLRLTYYDFFSSYRSGELKDKKYSILMLLTNYCPMKYIYLKLNNIIGYESDYSMKNCIRSYKSHCRWSYLNYLCKISQVIKIIFNFVEIPKEEIYLSLENATKQCKIEVVNTLLKYYNGNRKKLLDISEKRGCKVLKKTLTEVG